MTQSQYGSHSYSRFGHNRGNTCPQGAGTVISYSLVTSNALNDIFSRGVEFKNFVRNNLLRQIDPAAVCHGLEVIRLQFEKRERRAGCRPDLVVLLQGRIQ